MHTQPIVASRSMSGSREGRLVDRKQLPKKCALMIVASAMLFGCSQNVPTAPTPHPSQNSAPPSPDPIPPPQPPPSFPSSSGLLWGFVIDRSGACIADATVQVLSPALGQTIVQRTPCSVWDYDGGFLFTDLTPGVWLTLRAEAPGYMVAYPTFLPLSPSGYQAVEIVLTRIQND
jgi:hypothetical protein